MGRLLRSLSCVVLLASQACPALAVDLVRTAAPMSAHDPRRDYSRQLLLEVLRRTEPAFGPFQIQQAAEPMNRRRLLREMHEGQTVNVVANPADGEWLKELTAVWVPVDMGLQSWHIALIRASTQARLDKLRSGEDLKALRFGTANTWITTRSLEQSGFNIVAGENYDGLFGMLLAQRFDLLPRGVNEIFPEFDQRRPEAPELAIEQRFLLHDHIPSLFFVSPSAPHLAKRLSTGMEAMLKDGSLRRFLLTAYADALRRARLCERIVVDLPRPALPPELENRPELWFDPLDPRNGFCPAEPAPHHRPTAP